MSDETNCAYCGFTPPTHAENCPTLPENLREARPDEMAAGVIHEPGTGGGDPQDALKRAMIEDALVGERPPEDRDHCGYVEDTNPLFAISEHALDEIASVLFEYRSAAGNADDPLLDPPARRALGYITAARENGPIPEKGVLERYEHDYVSAAVLLTEAERASTIATQQRDFLSRQVDSLVQRLAASHVAGGLIDMAAAQGFVQKEILPINQVLAQIASQPQPEQST